MEKNMMHDLIERLEKATGPDRFLDAAIDGAVNGWERTGVHVDTKEPFVLPTVPYHTASIDAALTLVPEHWGKDIWLKRHNGHHWSCDLHVPSSERRGRHVHAPIAVCIAALAALTTTEGR